MNNEERALFIIPSRHSLHGLLHHSLFSGYRITRSALASTFGGIIRFSILDFRFTIDHRITRSALARTLGGMANPIWLAVLRLMISSNLVGCSTGRSPGLAPFKILST